MSARLQCVSIGAIASKNSARRKKLPSARHLYSERKPLAAMKAGIAGSCLIASSWSLPSRSKESTPSCSLPGMRQDLPSPASNCRICCAAPRRIIRSAEVWK
ncbi:DUF1156 domain-containing protein [Teichococcus deserti]|uniref:DUF1156 domain-containing protein n=1 Tax=Teichococcus deserti TaxID=1817963 RepID=UPI000D08B84E